MSVMVAFMLVNFSTMLTSMEEKKIVFTSGKMIFHFIFILDFQLAPFTFMHCFKMTHHLVPIGELFFTQEALCHRCHFSISIYADAYEYCQFILNFHFSNTVDPFIAIRINFIRSAMYVIPMP